MSYFQWNILMDWLPQTTYPIYAAEQFLDDVFMNEEDYDTLMQLMRRKECHSCMGHQV